MTDTTPPTDTQADEQPIVVEVARWAHTGWSDPHPPVVGDVLLRTNGANGAYALSAACATCDGVLLPLAFEHHDHTDPAAQALRDAVWQQGASIGRYKAAHSALTRQLGLDFCSTGGIVGRILSDLRRDVSGDYERVVDSALAAQAPATPGQRTVTVTVYTDEPGPDVTVVEALDGQVWYRRHDGLWDMSDNPVEIAAGHYSWRRLWGYTGPLVAVGTCARLRGDS